MPPSPKKDITAKTPNKVTIPFGIAIALPLLAPLYGKNYLLKAKIIMKIIIQCIIAI